MRLNLKTMRTSEEIGRIKAILRAERDRNASAPFLYDAKLAFLEDPETYRRALEIATSAREAVRLWLSEALPDDVFLCTERSSWPWK